MSEEWKTIPGYAGIYELSNLGRVRSCSRSVPHGKGTHTRQIQSKILRESINNGYRVVYLAPQGREVKIFYIEKAMLDLFPQEDSLPTQDGEAWKDITGYEGLYRISSLGRVWSLSRIVVHDDGARRFIRPRLMEIGTGKNGYQKVELAKTGSVDTLMVHRLVAKVFVPNPLNLEVVHHRDENKLNNRADNLEWVTRAGNVQDWFDRRRVVIGVDTIEAIIAAHAAGRSPAEILASLPRKHKKRI